MTEPSPARRWLSCLGLLAAGVLAWLAIIWVFDLLIGLPAW